MEPGTGLVLFYGTVSLRLEEVRRFCMRWLLGSAAGLTQRGREELGFHSQGQRGIKVSEEEVSCSKGHFQKINQQDDIRVDWYWLRAWKVRPNVRVTAGPARGAEDTAKGPGQQSRAEEARVSRNCRVHMNTP